MSDQHYLDLIEEARASTKFMPATPVGDRFRRLADALQELLDARQLIQQPQPLG